MRARLRASNTTPQSRSGASVTLASRWALGRRGGLEQHAIGNQTLGLFSAHPERISADLTGVLTRHWGRTSRSRRDVAIRRRTRLRGQWTVDQGMDHVAQQFSLYQLRIFEYVRRAVHRAGRNSRRL